MVINFFIHTFLKALSIYGQSHERDDAPQGQRGLCQRPIGEVLLVDLQDPVSDAEPAISVSVSLWEDVVYDDDTLGRKGGRR